MIFLIIITLEIDIRKKNKSAADKIVKKINSYGAKLERSHKRVLEALEALKAEEHTGDTANKLDKIESEINFYREDLEKKISRDTKEHNELIKLDMWDDLEKNVIQNLKRDIKGWLALDKKLIELEEKLVD